jgi:hypothetical protein
MPGAKLITIITELKRTRTPTLCRKQNAQHTGWWHHQLQKLFINNPFVQLFVGMEMWILKYERNA